MNWFKKSKTLDTKQLPEKLTQAIQFECGGIWDHSKPDSWTERLDQITQKQLGQEKGYSTSFWINCKTGDGYFHQKWGVSINFTVTSGSSHTTFDSETGDWDLGVTASVQWASPNSWTPETPYPLLIKSVGYKEDMKTIQEVANFVKMSIWNSQKDDGDDDEEPEDEPTPDPSIDEPSLQPVGVLS